MNHGPHLPAMHDKAQRAEHLLRTTTLTNVEIAHRLDCSSTFVASVNEDKKIRLFNRRSRNQWYVGGQLVSRD